MSTPQTMNDPSGAEHHGCLSRMSTDGAMDLEQKCMLNHCITHGSSFLAVTILGEDVASEVCSSARGFYIGCTDDQGPVARDSAEYWTTCIEAQKALDDHEWTQRLHP